MAFKISQVRGSDIEALKTVYHKAYSLDNSNALILQGHSDPEHATSAPQPMQSRRGSQAARLFKLVDMKSG
jgi:hypothetical protein